MKKVQKLLKEIFALALKVNFETNAGVWIDLAGHVDSVTIYACANKKEYECNLFRYSIYSLKNLENSKETFTLLENAKQDIENLYKEVLDAKRTNI